MKLRISRDALKSLCELPKRGEKYTMFRFQVKNLPIEMTGVRFKDIYNNVIESWIPVSDIMQEVINEDSTFLPDYGIAGYFHFDPIHGSLFQICEGGPHILYVTGRPKSNEIPPEHRKYFQIEDAIYRYFWEDSKYGYLTQVIHKHED